MPEIPAAVLVSHVLQWHASSLDQKSRTADVGVNLSHASRILSSQRRRSSKPSYAFGTVDLSHAHSDGTDRTRSSGMLVAKPWRASVAPSWPLRWCGQGLLSPTLFTRSPSMFGPSCEGSLHSKQKWLGEGG